MTSIYDADYFHGKIERSEINQLLQETGDFLVRESSKKPGEYAVSCKKPEKVQHFIIGVTADGDFTFEEDKFSTIPELIDHYMRNQIAITEASGVRMVTPISKHGGGVLQDDPPPRPPASAHREPPRPPMVVNDQFDDSPPPPPRPATDSGSMRSTSLADQPWFHGKIDKPILKTILFNEGDYLVRESTRTPGEYTISVMGPAKIKHFSISNIGGQYSLEESAFPSINLLCEHYRKNRVAVTTESGMLITTPIPKADTGYRFLEGDDDDEGGAGVVNVDSDLANQNWFHGTIPRPEIKSILTLSGAYLVRESAKSPGEYAISVYYDGRVQHFKINHSNAGFKFEGGAFPSISELMDHHQCSRVPITSQSGAVIKAPVSKAGSHATLMRKGSLKGFQEEVLDDLPWFHGKLERVDAKHMLRYEGNFLVRESTKKPGEFAVSVKGPSQKCQHFIIDQANGRYRFEGDFYDTIKELIDHYKNFGMPITAESRVVLVSPVNKKHGERWEGGATHNAQHEKKMQQLNKNYDKRHSDVKLGKKLGNGHFGEVMLGTMIRTGRKVAVKTCKPNVPDPGRFLEEADVLKGYDHPNIVQLVGVVSDMPIYIILELCLGGELLKFLKKNGPDYDVGQYVRHGLEGAEGMAYLHARNCIHRDLAARNCLVTEDGVVKISGDLLPACLPACLASVQIVSE